MSRRLVVFLCILACGRAASRVKRQDADVELSSEDSQKRLCQGKDGWFRLSTQDCREVVQCTDAGLQLLRCPHGLAFDLELQTCDWRDNVNNCDRKEKEKKAVPIINPNDPVCPDESQLNCADGTCINRDLFCDGKPDCVDGSDENICDVHNDPNRASPCNPQSCYLPECYCYNDPYETPLDPAATPQMIMLTFDDAINNNNMDLYETLFKERYNPNGCTIKATFFVSHKYTNYTAVQEMHRLGHEIAVHSISHNDSESFWTDATVEEWEKEMNGSRTIISKFAQIPVEEILGLRAPYLRVGGNRQFSMMERNSFFYDSTITAHLQNPPLWPYTLYYRMPHSCHGNAQKCPTRSFSAWEMVMNEMDRREDPTIPEELPGCAMVDSCFSNKPTREQFLNFLDNNFYRHYDHNKAPMGLFFHSAFLKNDPDILEAFLLWVDDLLATFKDVYFVTMTQVLQWLQSPVDINEAINFQGWKEKCVPQGEPHCFGGKNCKLTTEELPGETIRLSTCARCPAKYPWLNDPLGNGL